MAFTAKDVQALREKTGCGMMDCKKALVECDGDMDKAVDYLREKGLASQAKKATRVAAEGAVAVYTANGVSAIVEANTETDFVASNEEFKAFTAEVAKIVAEKNPADVETLLKTTNDEGATVEEMVQAIFLKFRENISVRRFARYEGKTASYVHAGGSIGVLVKFDTTDEIAAKDEFNALGKAVAMQVAAQNPSYLDKESVPADVLEKEKNILIAQMKEDPKMANKPEAILDKIVVGKLGKFYTENCLTEQEFIMDGDKTVAKHIAETAKAVGGDIKVTGFIRFEKGEGIQKREDNFADEVASMMK